MKLVSQTVVVISRMVNAGAGAQPGWTDATGRDWAMMEQSSPAGEVQASVWERM